VSDRTGGYYQRPDLTKLTEEAVQQAASSARRRQVIAQQLGVAVETTTEENQEEVPQEEVTAAQPEPQPVIPEPPRKLEDFSIDDLLHFGEEEEEVQA